VAGAGEVHIHQCVEQSYALTPELEQLLVAGLLL
jgi:hypothetical protein